MSERIHRNGNLYRLWGSITDRYLTEPMTLDEMFDFLSQGGDEKEIGDSLRRATAQGTSQYFRTRPTDAWDTERCAGCATFHHLYRRSRDGEDCDECGEPADDVSHQPPCEPG